MAGILDAFSKHGLFSEQLDLANEDPSTAHQMKGYDFAQNFPGAVPGGIYTPASFIGPALSKGYQYGQELSRSMLDGLGGYTIADALEAAKTQSNANIEGMLGKGFNMDTYNQNLEDFNIKDVNFANSFSMPSFSSAAQASQIEQPQNLGFTSMVDMANKANNFNSQFASPGRFSGMGQVGPNKSNMNAPAALDMDRFAGVSNLGRNDMDVEQVAQLGNQSMMQGLQNKIGAGFNNVKDFAMDKGNMGRNLLGSAGAMAMGLPGMVGSGLMSLLSNLRDPNAPSYQTRSPNIDYSNLNTNNLNDFYDSNEDSDTFGTTRFDRAKPGSFGSYRTLADYFNKNKTAKLAITQRKAKAEAAAQAEAQAAAANRAATRQMAEQNRQSGSGGYQAGYGGGFMGGSGTAADMGSFRDGGLASMFTRRR